MGLINFNPGAVGRKAYVTSATLSSGTVTLTIKEFTAVEHVSITEVDGGSTSAENYSYAFSNGSLVIVSSNGSSVEAISVFVIGY